MRDIIFETIKNTCQAYGCTTAKPLKKPHMYWPCINDATCTQIARESVGAIIGPENICSEEPSMGHESYSILASYYPSVMCALGAGNEEKGMTVGAHNPKHEPDEGCLKIGVAATIAYAKAFLAYKHPIPFQPFQGTVDEFLHPV